MFGTRLPLCTVEECFIHSNEALLKFCIWIKNGLIHDNEYIMGFNSVLNILINEYLFNVYQLGMNIG